MSHDRLGEHASIKLFRTSRGYMFGAGFVRGPWGWAGSIHWRLRTIWLRPIDYAAAERAGPYQRPPTHYSNRWLQFKRDVREAARAVYQGSQLEERQP